MAFTLSECEEISRVNISAAGNSTREAFKFASDAVENGLKRNSALSVACFMMTSLR